MDRTRMQAQAAQLRSQGGSVRDHHRMALARALRLETAADQGLGRAGEPGQTSDPHPRS